MKIFDPRPTELGEFLRMGRFAYLHPFSNTPGNLGAWVVQSNEPPGNDGGWEVTIDLSGPELDLTERACPLQR